MFCGARPWFLALDQVDFHRPVEIGSFLIIDAQIVYTGGDYCFTSKVRAIY